MMRLLTTMNVLARREDVDLFVPINPVSDPHGEAVVKANDRAYKFAQSKSIV